jgi:hypothetical protein
MRDNLMAIRSPSEKNDLSIGDLVATSLFDAGLQGMTWWPLGLQAGKNRKRKKTT